MKKILPILVTILFIVSVFPVANAITIKNDNSKNVESCDDVDLTIEVAKLEAGYKINKGEHYKITKPSGAPIIIDVPEDGSPIKVKYIVKYKQHDSADKQEAWEFSAELNGEAKSWEDNFDMPLFGDNHEGSFEWIREYKGKGYNPQEFKLYLGIFIIWKDWEDFEWEDGVMALDAVDIVVKYSLYEPKIQVQPENLVWNDVKTNQDVPEKTLTISNVGEDESLMDWEITSVPSFIELDKLEGEDLKKGESVRINVKVDPTYLNYNQKYNKKIVIESNGGNVEVGIEVTTESKNAKKTGIVMFNKIKNFFPLLFHDISK